VADFNGGDGSIGIFQQCLVADNAQHRETLTRFIPIDTADDGMLKLMSCNRIHVEFPIAPSARM
jgi:hypothetical protein